MRNLILIISIAILIGGTYSIGFYNGNNNASKTITLAKNGGEQYLKSVSYTHLRAHETDS